MAGEEQPADQPGSAEGERTTRGKTEVDTGGPAQNQAALDNLIEEADALALYVAQHGDSLLGEDNEKGLKLHQELLEAVNTARKSRSGNDWKRLMTAYAKTSAVTYKERGVNGRTILDTRRKMRGWRGLRATRNVPIVWGVVFFVLALVLEALMGWSGRISDPTKLNGIKGFYALTGTLSPFLVPAAWGAIGACVSLAKRVSTKLFEMAYEEARMRGIPTRIFLGAMLGVAVVVLLFPDFDEQIQVGDANLGPAIAAFVTGLFVKPVYAAFESLSEGLAGRFRGSKAQTPK